MGARPIACLDSLRFGELDAPRMKYLVDGVVRGISGYGNCIGIPTVGGETSFHRSYNGTVTEPFNDYMGGITKKAYYNTYPRFKDTNNLSAAIFISYAGFKILFPGDLEEDGWLAMLEQDAFRADLAGINVLVASHHGRDNGYCSEVFDYCSPQVIVMSDKAIVHDTQHMAQTYRYHVMKVYPDGVNVATTGKKRHVLTTRRDGHIEFRVMADGSFYINTEYRG